MSILLRTALATALSAIVLVPFPVEAADEEVILAGDQAFAHPVGQLAVKYAALVHAGKTEELQKLRSRGALKRRQEMAPEERRESDDYMRKMVPAPGQLEADIKAASQLILVGSKAYLNTIKSESRTNPDGSVTTSSSSTNMPFEREDGVWKVAQ